MKLNQPELSKTPRTDQEAVEVKIYSNKALVLRLGFGHELERELNESRAINRECIRQLEEACAALKACLKDSIELLDERRWWKNEPRYNYSQRYAQTQENILKAQDVLLI